MKHLSPVSGVEETRCLEGPGILVFTKGAAVDCAPVRETEKQLQQDEAIVSIPPAHWLIWIFMGYGVLTEDKLIPFSFLQFLLCNESESNLTVGQLILEELNLSSRTATESMTYS